MKPIMFLEITAKKLKDSSHESDSRTSAGRSYYAIYHEIKSTLEAEGQIIIPNNHGLLSQCFFFSGATSNIREIGIGLQTLYTYRRKADYKLNVKVERRHAREAYKLACAIYENFSNLFKGETKNTILVGTKSVINLKKGLLN